VLENDEMSFSQISQHKNNLLHEKIIKNTNITVRKTEKRDDDNVLSYKKECKNQKILAKL
jgi:hypothetical protein